MNRLHYHYTVNHYDAIHNTNNVPSNEHLFLWIARSLSYTSVGIKATGIEGMFLSYARSKYYTYYIKFLMKIHIFFITCLSHWVIPFLIGLNTNSSKEELLWDHPVV